MAKLIATATELLSFPDLSLPKYHDLFGEEALNVATTRLFSWLQLSLAGRPGTRFVLRYVYDPTRTPTSKRLRIFVIQYSAADEPADAIGRQLVGETFNLVSRELDEASPVEEDLSFLASIERQARLIHDGSSLFYLPAVWNREQLSRDSREPYLDETLSALDAPCFLDIQLYSVDCTQARESLRATIDRLTKGSSLVAQNGERLSHYQTLSSALAGEPACRLLICAGSRVPKVAASLLRAFGIDAIGGSNFKVRLAEPGGSLQTRLRAALQHEEYQFADRDGWFSSTLRDAVAKEGSAVSEAQSVTLRQHSELAVLAGPNLVRDVLTLPIPRRGYLRTFPLETEERQAGREIVGAQNKQDFIVLGRDLERKSDIELPISDLTRHAFVAGVTGSGKTVAMLNITQQLAAQGIPFLVLEPAKSEYRALSGFSPLNNLLRIFTPGRDDLSPLRINPFAFESHISLVTHIGGLAAAFTCALELFSPLSAILENTIWQMYERHGWREDDFGDAGNPLPRVADLLTAVCSGIDDMGYDPEVRDRFKGAIRSRFLRLSRGSVGRVFNSSISSPSIADLCGGQTLVELASLTQHESNLVIMFLMIAVREHLSKAPAVDGRPRLVIVIEEAHNLVPAVSDERSGNEEASAKIEASRYVSNMLAEMRALGLSIIVVDQTPAAVAPQVVRNTNLKIAHRTVAKQDRETLADAMLMHPAHAELLGRLTPGQAYIYADRFYRPHLSMTPFRQADVPVSKDPTRQSVAPNDQELVGWMGKQGWFKGQLLWRIAEMDRSTITLLDSIGTVGEMLERKRHELMGAFDTLNSSAPEGKQRAAAEFDRVQSGHATEFQVEFASLVSRIASLEAEYRSIVKAAKNAKIKAHDGKSIADARELVAMLQMVGQQLGIISQ